jgi:hypothetical protein
MKRFSDLPLHDTALESFTVLWGLEQVVARVSVFGPSGEGVPYELCWESVTKVSIPHHAPWGDSFFVTGHGQEDQRFWIELRSGDVLEIWAQDVVVRRIE